MSEITAIPYAIGIDIGSTTVKTVVLDEEHHVLSSSYERHFSKVRETVCGKLGELAQQYPADAMRVSITGSAGLGLAQAAKLPSLSWAVRMPRSSSSPAVWNSA